MQWALGLGVGVLVAAVEDSVVVDRPEPLVVMLVGPDRQVDIVVA